MPTYFCPTCEGDGVVDATRGNVYDPQNWREATCPECAGDGYVESFAGDDLRPYTPSKRKRYPRGRDVLAELADRRAQVLRATDPRNRAWLRRGHDGAARVAGLPVRLPA